MPSQNYDLRFGRVPCNFHAVGIATCISTLIHATRASKTPDHGKTDGLTSGVFLLPPRQEYTFQSTREKVVHTTVVTEFAAPG